MKKLPLILLAGLMIAGNARLFAQTSTQWPESSSSVSVFGSSLLLIATPVNISFEKLYLRNNIYLGYTYGPTILFLTKSLYDSHGLGGHLAFTLLTGKRNRHFEGSSVSPIPLLSFTQHMEKTGSTYHSSLSCPLGTGSRSLTAKPFTALP